jgi:glycosyltransferase involved in cell wall biosynthesis
MAHVSFIIPAFNCARTLRETVASIYAGNLCEGDEVVIVDDASTDATADIVLQLKQESPSIRSIGHRHNKGGGAARNTAVELATHEMLFCLDSDNVLAPYSVPKLQQFLTDTGADVAAFQELHYFVENSSEVTHKWIFKPGQITFADYLAGAIVAGASGNYLFTRNSWVRARGYPEFAGALDAWGFGLRQVGTGQKMMVMSNSHYHHRYGHESYWVREARRGKTSLIALQLLIPFLEQLNAQDVDYIMGPSGRLIWFDQLDQRPLRLKSGQRGVSGVSEGVAPDSTPVIGIARRLLESLARRFGVR